MIAMREFAIRINDINQKEAKKEIEKLILLEEEKLNCELEINCVRQEIKSLESIRNYEKRLKEFYETEYVKLCLNNVLDDSQSEIIDDEFIDEWIMQKNQEDYSALMDELEKLEMHLERIKTEIKKIASELKKEKSECINHSYLGSSLNEISCG